MNKVLLAIIVLYFCSCAHKSGHNRRVSSPEQSGIEASNTNIPNNGDNDYNIEVVDLDPGTPNHQEVELTGSEIFSKYNTAVFMVFTSDEIAGYQGSGFFIDSKGLAVSNYHVFEGTTIGAEQIKLASSNEVFKVIEIIHRDYDEDFILFRVNAAPTNYIPLAEQKPRVGEKVYAIGSPRGLENTFSSGEVSQWRDQNLMQISALIDHGSSGGALINEYGEVVGITSGSFADGSQANLNYAWSIDAIKPYIIRR